MCTAIVYADGDSYFGRNLDLEVSVGEKVVLTPRNYAFDFREEQSMPHHYAMTGIGPVIDGYPLYCDAVNEKGLGMAGLNFEGLAHFFEEDPDKQNVSPFEFIPYILGQCDDVESAKRMLQHLNLVNIDFSAQLPLAPLHYMIADQKGNAITVESTKSGLHVYDNPLGVMTNNPEFPQQMTNIANYQNVAPGAPTNTLVPGVALNTYSRALASNMLPGGMDSESRFVRVAFAKAHAPEGHSEMDFVTNYFHIMNAVAQPKNLDEVKKDTFEYTIYTDCINMKTKTLYYTTYDNAQINAVSFDDSYIDDSQLKTFELCKKQSIHHQN